MSSRFLNSNGPTKEELKAAIDVCLKENKGADIQTIKAQLQEDNPTWNVPERRLKKILKSQTALSESASVASTGRFSMVKGASKRLFGARKAANAEDTATAPLGEEQPPMEVVTTTTTTTPTTEEAVVAKEEPETPVTVAEGEGEAEMYKDDNDGKKDTCAACQNCTVM